MRRRPARQRRAGTAAHNDPRYVKRLAGQQLTARARRRTTLAGRPLPPAHAEPEGGQIAPGMARSDQAHNPANSPGWSCFTDRPAAPLTSC
ncbi:hypothetical protein [Erwinia pyrifoliae]|uniref:hypothetical protein n=1 Tax=Erwinia pyrifoliae TaxID=79967 RepID=UPI0012FECD82|nr:hypothetical protein [Erwinia pyrifoliae]MCU8588868.1 hypothetical protein [Erwinia pyrifoliae]